MEYFIAILIVYIIVVFCFLAILEDLEEKNKLLLDKNNGIDKNTNNN